MTWHLAPCLAQLRSQLDAAYPNRSRISDGTIGDAAHASRSSRHNPDAHGFVNAFDITANPTDTPGIGMNGYQLAQALTRDKRSANVIWYGQIWNPARGWHTYTGPSAHREHVHLDTTDAGRDDTTPWVLAAPHPSEEDMALKIWNEKGKATKYLVEWNANGYVGWSIPSLAKLQKIKADFPNVPEEEQGPDVMGRLVVLGPLP